MIGLNVGSFRQAVWAPMKMGAEALSSCHDSASRACSAAGRGIRRTARMINDQIPYTSLAAAAACRYAYDPAPEMSHALFFTSFVAMSHFVPAAFQSVLSWWGDSTRETTGPGEELRAGFTPLDEITPPEGVGSDDSDVKRAQEEFVETLRFWSAHAYYNILLSWFGTPAEQDSFTRVMREVLTVGRDITDPETRYALRKEKFLTELVGGEVRAGSSVAQFAQDVWAYIKKYLLVGTVLYIIEFNSEEFIKNSMVYFDEVLKKISNQNSSTPENAIEVRHFLYAEEALNNIKNARRSWARDPRGGNAEMHMGPLLGTEFGFNRKDLYRFAGRLAADTFIPTLGTADRPSRLVPKGEYLFNPLHQGDTPGKRYVGFDLLSQYMVRLENLAHDANFSLFDGSENIGLLGRLFIALTRAIDLPLSNIRRFADRLESEHLSGALSIAEKSVRTLAASVLFYMPYVALLCVDQLIHASTTFFIKKVITDQQELLRQIIEGTRDGMTLDRPQQYMLKKQIRDQLYAVLKEMQEPQEASDPHPPMPNKMRDVVKSLLATTQTLVFESEYRTQEELTAAIKNNESWFSYLPSVVRPYLQDKKEKIHEEAIELLASLTGATIAANMEEAKRNVYLTKGIRAAANSLTKLEESRPVSDADIGQLDREIKELRKLLTHTIIDRAVQDLTEGTSNESKQKQLLTELRSANAEFGNFAKACRQLVTEYQAGTSEQKAAKGEELYKRVTEFGDRWMATMGKVQNSDAISSEAKKVVYDRFKELNKILVHFRSKNAAKEMKLHRTNTHTALHSGRPLRDSGDITANLAHIKRSTHLDALLKESIHAKRRMETSVAKLLNDLEIAAQEGRSQEELAAIKDRLQVQSTAFSEQVRRLKDLKNIESLRVFDPRDEEGAQISAQEFRESLFTPLVATEMLLNTRGGDVKEAIDTLSAAQTLERANILGELAEKATEALPTRSLFGRFFTNQGVADVIKRIKDEYIAPMPNSVGKHTLIARLGEINSCRDADSVTQAMAQIREELGNIKTSAREALTTTRNSLQEMQAANTTMFVTKEEAWRQGIFVDEKHIHGLDTIQDHLNACVERVERAVNKIPRALLEEGDFLEISEEMERNRAAGGVTQLFFRVVRPFLPKIKKEIADIVIKKTDVMMGIVDKGYAIQAVLDQAILAFVREETGDTKFPRTARLIQAEEAPAG